MKARDKRKRSRSKHREARDKRKRSRLQKRLVKAGVIRNYRKAPA